MPKRLEQLKQWLESELEFRDYTINPASSDASFRRYFRVVHNGENFIVMDAPPEQEDSRPFIKISKLLFDAGLHVPEVIDNDLEQGFLLLSDLGSKLYLDALGESSVERLYGDALGALATLQTCATASGWLKSTSASRWMQQTTTCWMRRSRCWPTMRWRSRRSLCTVITTRVT
jgi:aminoglycoside/choline kinase family phosphotransferase